MILKETDICIRCQRDRKIYSKGLCRSCYVTIHTDNEKRKQDYIKYRGTNYKNNCIIGKKRVKKDIRPYKPACSILVEHHEAMKDDPEHLTTEFIKKLIKVDCKEV